LAGAENFLMDEKADEVPNLEGATQVSREIRCGYGGGRP
jgi:hypothetical protein